MTSFDLDRSRYDSSNAPRLQGTSTGDNFRGAQSGTDAYNDDTSRRLDAALHSPYGIDKLLNRLKQSIYSTREFSAFLKERCALEDRHAQGYKKLVRTTTEAIRRSEARQGSYSRYYGEILQVNDKLAENGIAFASALHTMSEELRDVADNAERDRKKWKHTTIDAEKRLSEAETAQQKAKDRYNNAADQYDRARTGEKQGVKFGLKNKSPAQQEEALKEKADMLDDEYAQRYKAAQTQKREFEDVTRPQIVRALKDTIDECDAALAMQMAKLASVSEKHVVSSGMAIAPFKTPGSDTEPRGLRQIARDIDDRRDFSEYMLDGVEPPPLLKGRSRRNTDAELITAPATRADLMDTTYTPTQSYVESRPPQLPQIGGSEAFSRSFDGDRPVLQNNRSSYIGGPSDALSSHPTNQSQQTGVTKDPLPSIPTTRMPAGPSLPSYDRGQASPTENFNGNNGYGRGPTSARQDTMPATTGIGRPSMDAPPYDRNQGPVRQETMPVTGGRGQPTTGDSYTDRNQGGLRQETTPTFGGRGQPTSTESYPERAPGPVRHDTSSALTGGLPGAFPEPSPGPARQETLPPTVGQGRTSMDTSRYNRDQGTGRPDDAPPYAGRGQTGPTAALASIGQGPTRQGTMPSSGLKDLPLGRENPYIGNNQDPNPVGSGVGQPSVGRENPYMGNTQSPTASTNIRDQIPVGRENPYMSNTQTSGPAVTGGREQLPVGRENLHTGNKQDAVPSTAGRDLPLGRENPYIGNNQDPVLPAVGRGQPLVGRENPYIGNNQDLISTAGGRGQPAVGSSPIGRENPYMGNNQDPNKRLSQGPISGSYPGASTLQSSTDGSGFGRGQGAQGIFPAGRGGPGAGRGILPSQQQALAQPPRPMLPPNKPVFGMHLDELFRRDGTAVPTIVFQCIQAVDMYGLNTQGIYRVSGSVPTVQQLKSEFDHGK